MGDKKSKTIPCKSCEHEVAKSAKKCPNCGQQLKTGLFTKIVLVFVILAVIAVISTPSTESRLTALAQAPVSDLSPYGELYDAFLVFSDYTDVQRQNLENEITGQTVAWELPVYEVDQVRDGVYRVQTAFGDGAVGAFVEIYTSTPDEVSYIESLRTDDMLSFKGTIQGTALRHIEISPAVLTR